MRKRFLVAFTVILALAGMCGAQAPAPGTPGTSGPGVYRFCTVQVRDAGDPLMDQYYGQPSHWYYSGIYSSGADRSQEFMKWVYSHYGHTWVVNPVNVYRGVISACNRYGTLAEAQKPLGAAASDGYQRRSNVYTTHTGWPDVPPNTKQKR